MAYQIGFDLYESATQQFLQSVQAALRQTAPAPIQTTAPPTHAPTQPEGEGEEESAMDVDEKKAVIAPVPPAAPLSEADKLVQDRLTKLHTILGGDTTIALHLQFLIRSNKTDLLVLKNTKDAVRNSVCHNATVMANAFMHCGTTSDQFLRDNLEWLARATNWAKFTATASLGVIHKGHEKEALHLMSTYLPKDSSPGSAYSEGGGLYALGLIHANHGGEITEYLLTQLKEASTDIVRHGACLGVGLAAMGTARQDVYDQLKTHLNQDEAITGEAAGIGIGLVMLGTKSEQAISDMVSYAAETQHEKILRGLAVGIALTMYGRLEESETLVEQLSRDKDPILRWSAMYTVAMAYCGTGNNGAIQRLLHAAVSDVNDDVRRAAVTSLGFLLFRMPEQCPSVLSLLSESYNPHVRYGAAMALGIACAGTGLKDAIALLEPLTNDPVNYVRQGALVASALVLMQQNESTCAKMPHFRQLYAKVIADKHEDVMAKFGAILAQGIIDAGGRNTTISLQSRTGHTNMAAVVGLLVFVQFWYWYPLTHFLSLALSPTCVVALNIDLNMPKIEFKSNARPSVFAYPPALEEKKDKSKEKVETAVLSTTAKQAKRKEAAAATAAATAPSVTSVGSTAAADKKKEEKMDVDEEKATEVDKTAKPEVDKTAKPAEAEKKEDKKEDKAVTNGDKKDEGEKKEEEQKKEAEPSFEMLSNPIRVMKAQLKVLSMPTGSRYIPLKDISVGGIIMMKNARPTETEDIIELVAAGGPKGEEETEPEPPEPFEWNDD
jgi:26S proteasome regulatory subunit N2